MMHEARLRLPVVQRLLQRIEREIRPHGRTRPPPDNPP